MAVSIDILRLGMSFTWANIVWVQLEFPIHLIINTAPIFLGLFALIGGVRQDKIEILNKQLLEKIESQKQTIKASSENLLVTLGQKDRMEAELNIAKDIQLSMLPLIFPAFPYREDINIYAHLVPAKEVGGDFYDFYFLDEDNLCFVVGDVSGKGVPAALMMAVCKTLLKSKASNEKSTAKIITSVNQEMALQNKNYMFVTIFMGILNTSTGELIYTNAGHNPTLVRQKNGNFFKLTDLHGPVVAAMENIAYQETKLQLDRGDVIFAYTDGITEAHSPEGELFTEQRLVDLFKNNTCVPEKCVKTIVKMVQDFETGQDPFDDLTALCLHFIGSDRVAVYYAKIEVKNRVSDIQVAMDNFGKFAQEHQISSHVQAQIKIIFDELLANIISYGFLDKDEHIIDIEIRYNGEKIIVIFSDDGIPFNPFEKTAPDMQVPLNEVELGGLGIHIVKELADDYSYKRSIGKNIVSITRVINPE